MKLNMHLFYTSEDSFQNNKDLVASLSVGKETTEKSIIYRYEISFQQTKVVIFQLYQNTTNTEYSKISPLSLLINIIRPHTQHIIRRTKFCRCQAEDFSSC